VRTRWSHRDPGVFNRSISKDRRLNNRMTILDATATQRQTAAPSVLPGMIALVKLRRLREGDVLDDGGVVLVRGGGLDPEVLRADACLTLTTMRNLGRGGDAMDLVADLNAEDDEGLGWSDLSDAADPCRILPGAMLVAGNRFGRAVVRVVAVDQDGQVHFTVLPGSVEKNRHLIGRALA
jgi:hypothetical protein